MRFFILLIALIGLSTPLLAGQLNYRKSYSGHNVQFYYEWQDLFGEKHKVHFNLPLKDMEQGNREFEAYDNHKASAYIYKRMKSRADELSQGGMKIDIRQVGNGIKMEAQGAPEAQLYTALNELKQLQLDARNDYVKGKLYSFVNETTVMPDHPRIAARYTRAMRPVAEALAAQVRGKSQREVINHVLSFLQTMPYNQLLSRVTSNGAGYQTPYGLLYENRGDCDTKSVAFAAIMRNLYPNLRMVMVYVPGHAFIGMNIPAQNDDVALRLGGTNFVLAEPVGPSLVPVGMIAPDSAAYLRGRNYSYQEIPFNES